MEKGNLSEHHLEAAVLKPIKRFDGNLEKGAGIGNDYSLIAGIISAQGTGSEPDIAWHKGLNNYMCSCGKPAGASITMLLPKIVKQSEIKAYMDRFVKLSEQYGIQITGGESKVISGLDKPEFIVHFIGEKVSFYPDKKKITEGNDIVFIGYAGTLGTNMIICDNHEKLLKRFDGMYVENALFNSDDFSAFEVINELINCGNTKDNSIYYIHDVSFGGIYSALWQLGKWSGRGFMIDNKKISLRQETIELCEFFDINPYLIDGTGGLLIICNNGYKIVEQLDKKKKTASVIGQITTGKACLVKVSDDDIRTLSPVAGDDVLKIKTE